MTERRRETAEEASSKPDSTNDQLLVVRGLKVHFPIKHGILFDRTVGAVQAVDGVDLDVPRGRTFGLVGESGCGKSTLGRAILRLVEPTAGNVRFDGVDVASLQGEKLRSMRRRMQMVFQDPLASLNPRQSVETIISEPLRAHGIEYSKKNRVREVLDLVGLPASAATRFPHEFSGGQRQRIGIARAVALEPELIIADEPVSALDVSIQAQIINLLEELQERLGLTYLVIAHDLAVVRHISEEIAVMYLGGIVEQTDSEQLYLTPRHPYTIALMSAVPVPDPAIEDHRQRILLSGDLPSPANPPSGCRFHTRCPYRQETRCDTERPELRLISPGHRVACHYAEEIVAGTVTPKVDAALPV
ncbi:MAG: ATP-binding cassette domain-containing protein [Nocardioidaceae bacterium]|nr:ATP-binding cassette domain-containing protein [Nocardioidaceae bacterium]